MRDVPWHAYESLVEANGNGPLRIVYDQGCTEIELPASPHDRVKSILGMCIEQYGLTAGVPFIPTGSTTWKNQTRGVGLEADESYYVRHYQDVVTSREIDLARHPPPDLAIEADLTHRSVDKMRVYARLGVPEVWRWVFDPQREGRGGRLVCLQLSGNGDYEESTSSVAFPDLPLDWVQRAIEQSEEEGEYVAVNAFRARLRDRPEA